MLCGNSSDNKILLDFGISDNRILLGLVYHLITVYH